MLLPSTRDTDKLERVQQMRTKMVCCLKHMTYKEKLKELGFLRLVKRMLIVEWTLITFFNYLKGEALIERK